MSAKLASDKAVQRILLRPITEREFLIWSSIALAFAVWNFVVVWCDWARWLAMPTFLTGVFASPALAVSELCLLVRNGWRVRLGIAAALSLLATVLLGLFVFGRFIHFLVYGIS